MSDNLAGKAIRTILNPKGLPLGAAIKDLAKNVVAAVRNKDKTDVE